MVVFDRKRAQLQWHTRRFVQEPQGATTRVAQVVRTTLLDRPY